MSLSFTRRLSQCVALTFITLLVSPVCLSSQHGHQARARRQLHFRNEWASWSGWNPVGGPCPGDPRQYKICNSKECPLGSVDFREMQCNAFNDRPMVAGNQYKWTTFHGGPNPCELSCLALGHNFYYNFGRVLDGTSCQKESGAICVNGRCLKPGCDLILGSEQQEDACMVCGGHNTTCMHHRSVYQDDGQRAGSLGYNEVTMIPAGATHIRVTDNSRNYLALQDGRSQFVINGNWKISVPGEYNIAGTKLLYRRSSDTWESFEVPGPTQEDLHVMVLSTDRNSGIEYEYWLPPDRYALYHGRKSPLRQPHHSASFTPWRLPAATTTTTTTTTTTRAPPTATRTFWVPAGGWPAQPPRQQPQPRLERDETRRNLLPRPSRGGHCGKCRKVRGRGERQRQYCQKDFVFRAKILGKHYRGEETRYDVQIIHTYRNRFRLEHREFLWVANVCDCPHLDEGHQYVLMARRHINYEHTLNRILLEEDSYVTPYRPREDALLRPLEELCNVSWNIGTLRPSAAGAAFISTA
ncbi:hypothetical protein JZ751_020714 [Albula glossodonta]|uniref:NTR domain-containing protein n=1 Tax=Albula glossodonta TaxID=121402 RepID=A0A8T2PLK2_9TELE|nr:hypothetical protein JZ751_020714 [Albula glossodonta]